MILLYTTLIFVLGVATFLIGRRVKSLEKKYARVAKETDGLSKQTAYKDGNSNRLDPCVAAKRQYMLGLLVQKRDRVEAKYVAWQSVGDKFKHYVAKLKSWKGKKLPYTFGAVDVACVLGMIDYLGFQDYVSVHALIQYITGLFTR
jgi:hypothetical protein